MLQQLTTTHDLQYFIINLFGLIYPHSDSSILLHFHFVFGFFFLHNIKRVSTFCLDLIYILNYSSFISSLNIFIVQCIIICVCNVYYHWILCMFGKLLSFGVFINKQSALIGCHSAAFQYQKIVLLFRTLHCSAKSILY